MKIKFILILDILVIVCLSASTSTTLTSLIMGKEKRTLHRVANATTAPSFFVSSNARKWVYRGVIRERYRLSFYVGVQYRRIRPYVGVTDRGGSD